MKPQTHAEWFKTVDGPGEWKDYLLSKDAWDTAQAATKESAVLIANKRANDFPESNEYYNCNDELRTVCEDIAEDIGKL